jgi:hypothetical protein
MFKNFFFLRSVPFVLCSLLAPDTGGGSGGGPAPATPPEPTGTSHEEKLSSAKTIIGDLFKKLGTSLADLTKAQGDYKTLEGQFSSLKDTAEQEKTGHATTKGLLETEKGAHTATSGKLVTAEKNVTRLESLCNLKGIDPNQVVPPAPAAKTGEQTREDLAAQLEKEKDPLKRNEIANQLREFDRKAKEKK